jgi:4'-phosphopantetheinyl transferase
LKLFPKNWNQSTQRSRVKIVSRTSILSPWDLPPPGVTIASNEVHVWRASLDASPTQIDTFMQILAADEQARANRFYFQIDRERFISAHGILRSILGLYLNQAPKCLSFRYGAHGKPALSFESGVDAIRFNLSHSHEVALYAITRGREIGIDVELIRDLEVVQIAERFFSRQETAILGAMPASVRKHAFFLCWTRKEAYIKARGEGLSLPLDQFDVSLIPGEPAALLCTRPNSDEADRWSMQELNPGTDYVAAIAVEGGDWSLSCWQWPCFAASSTALLR